MNLYARVTVDVDGVAKHLAIDKRESMSDLVSLVKALSEKDDSGALDAVSGALASDPEQCVTALVGRGVTAVRNAAKAAAKRTPSESGGATVLDSI